MLAGDVNYPRAKEAIFLLFKSARFSNHFEHRCQRQQTLGLPKYEHETNAETSVNYLE
jgi:hypothetical protein